MNAITTRLLGSSIRTAKDSAAPRPGPRGLVLGIALCAIAISGFGVLLPATAAAGPPVKTALINGDSVTTYNGFEKEGTPISLEQYAAEQAGFSVTVASGSEWAAMTANEFSQYTVLVIGDPSCGTAPASAIESAPEWTSAVMATGGSHTQVGNRVLVGTDPAFHYPENNGAEHLVQDGIAYAGTAEGATGVYFDSSCGDVGGLEVSAVLDHLTVDAPGHWTSSSEPPCGGSVRQVASIPAFETGESKLLDSDIEGWGCSVHQTYPAFPSDWYAVAIATDTETKPTCGVDPETKEEICGQAYVLAAGGSIVAEAPNVKITPTEGSDAVGASHSVTVMVERGEPLEGVDVTFVVTGQNAGVQGTCTTSGGEADPGCKTDSTGGVVFTYTDEAGAGTDTINASVTLGEATQHATAAETWIAGLPSVTTEPTIPGASPTPGGSLTGDPGQFSEAEEETYQWQLCTTAEPSTCVDIPGATGTNFTPEEGQLGDYLRFVVTAKGPGGSAQGASAVVGPVKATVIPKGSGTPAPVARPAPLVIAPAPCTSKRMETIHWGIRTGIHVRRIVVLLNGVTYRTLSGKARLTAISLAGRAAGPVQIKIEAIGAHGRRYTNTREYHPCVAGASHHTLKSLALRG